MNKSNTQFNDFSKLKYRMKLNILEVIYSSTLNSSLSSIIDILTRSILSNDNYLLKYLKYWKIISRFFNSLIQSCILFNYSSDFGGFILRFIKIKSDLSITPLNEIDNSIKLSYILINYVLIPILFEVFNYFCTNSNHKYPLICKIIKYIFNIYNLVNVIVKLLYTLNKKFIYFDILDIAYGLFTVNKGPKKLNDKLLEGGSRQINTFILFMVLKLGEWLNSKDKDYNSSNIIEPPIDNQLLISKTIVKENTRKISKMSSKNNNKINFIEYHSDYDYEEYNNLSNINNIKTNNKNEFNKYNNDYLTNNNENVNCFMCKNIKNLLKNPIVCRLCGVVACEKCITLKTLNSNNNIEKTICCNNIFKGLFQHDGILGNKKSNNSSSNSCYIKLYDLNQYINN